MSAKVSTTNQPAAQDPPTFATDDSQVTDLLSSFAATARQATAFLAKWPANLNSVYVPYYLLFLVASVAAILPTSDSEEDLQRAIHAMAEKILSVQREMSAERTTNKREHKPETETKPVVDVEDTQVDRNLDTTNEITDPSATSATPISPNEELGKNIVELSLVAQKSFLDVPSASLLIVAPSVADNEEQVLGTGSATSSGNANEGEKTVDTPSNNEVTAHLEHTHPKGRRQLFLKSRREQSKGQSTSPVPPPATGTLSQQVETEPQVAFPTSTTLVPSSSGIPLRLARSSKSPAALNPLPSSLPQPTVEAQAIEVNKPASNVPSQLFSNDATSSFNLALVQPPLESVGTQAQAQITTSVAGKSGNTAQNDTNNDTKDNTGNNPDNDPTNGAAAYSSSAADAATNGDSCPSARPFSPLPPLPPRFFRRPLRREGAIIIPRPRTKSCPTVPLSRGHTMALARNSNPSAVGGGTSSSSRVAPQEMSEGSSEQDLSKKADDAVRIKEEDVEKERQKGKTESEEDTAKDRNGGVAQKRGNKSKWKGKDALEESEQEDKENEDPQSRAPAKSKDVEKEGLKEIDGMRNELKPTGTDKGKAKATQQEDVSEREEQVDEVEKPNATTSRSANSRKRARGVEQKNGEEMKDEDERPTRRLRYSTRKQRD
ncbi:hypothetical protein AX16_005264 [Volvariella volvacea WC 439]|nr:hypothetical protein AX16_005264 [Volvariella volvacea WC 439]